MRAFSLVAPLPSGTTVLEASAGTGKTYAIAALAARFLAEGRAGVDDLLLVTFSRAATAELRSRVRERVRGSADALRAHLAGGPEPIDEVDAHLCSGTDADLAERLRRLERAFVHFDRATIMTTHEFCHGMIRGLGVLASQEPQSHLVEDLTGLTDEVGADVYLRRYAHDARRPPFTWTDGDGRQDDVGARTIAREATRVDAPLALTDADGSPGERVRFAQEVRDRFAERKRSSRIFSFDDQLTRLRDALLDPASGELAQARLAGRYPVVLVDEFQDTDPVQWEILHAAFDGRATLVLIGDPKQSIYAFRGADVHTYTSAVRSATTRTTLAVNHRADPQVVDAVGALFAGVRLGDEIDVPPVQAARRRPLLSAEPGSVWAAGVQLRVVEGENLPSWVAHDRIADDLVPLVGELLGQNAPLSRPHGPLRARDVAILVRSNRRGHHLARALSRTGIPATFSGTSSVFESPAAGDWLTLLRALDQPRRPHVQRAVITDFVGGTVARLATATEEDWSTWSLRLHSWARVVRRSGVPALMAAFDRDTDFTARLLRRPDGERLVTDHRHLAELLHERSGGHGRAVGHEGPRGQGVDVRDLAAWLEVTLTDPTASAERTRRLDTDADAVQIMTIHRAKGLQFPVVLLPEASHSYERAEDQGRTLVWQTPLGRQLDVGGRSAPGRSERWRRSGADEADESLRALYVGLTRAESHVVAWWASHRDTATSPLHRLVHATHDGPPCRPALAYDPGGLPDGGSPLALPWLPAAGIAVTSASPPADLRADAPASVPPQPQPLAAREWTRTIDATWRRTSYTGLTAAAHEAPPDAGLLADEASDVAVEPDPALATPSPLADFPPGAAFGTLVHAVLERLDPRGPGWRDALADAVAEIVPLVPLRGVEASALAEALAPTLETPLGPLAPGLTLRDFGPGNRLTEMDFEFSLAAPHRTLQDVAHLFRRHVPPGDPLAAYADRLSDPVLASQPLHGFLTGSVDAVLRLPGGRHLVVDYKTNRLGTGRPAATDEAGPDAVTLGHYTPATMAAAMAANHYPLQALLYCVALHRFLRVRLKGYQPGRHLGGVAYLFVRGMGGPATPLVDGHPTGVFSWRPPIGLVGDLSDLLAGGAL